MWKSWLLHRRPNLTNSDKDNIGVIQFYMIDFTCLQLCTLLWESMTEFFNYLRMSVKSLGDLLEWIKDKFSTNTIVKDFCPEQKHGMTLTESFMIVLYDTNPFIYKPHQIGSMWQWRGCRQGDILTFIPVTNHGESPRCNQGCHGNA